MIFYGNGTVWDATRDLPLCKFKKTGIRHGYLKTTDPNLIERLRELGYKYEYTEEDIALAEKKASSKNK